MAKSKVTVERIKLTVKDDSRNRDIFFVVSYPVKDGRPLEKALPLIVFATGYGGDATNYAPLYDFWVRAGYVVTSATFPDNDDIPTDIKFVRDETLRRSPDRNVGGKRWPKIDGDHVALVGKSLGAVASFATAFNPKFHDDVFDAVVAMTGVSTSADRLEDYPTPLLLIHGDADELLPVAGSQDAYNRASGPKYFVTILGGSHGSAFGGGDSKSEKVVEKTVIDFLDLYLKDKKSAAARLKKHSDVPDVSTLQEAP